MCIVHTGIVSVSIQGHIGKFSRIIREIAQKATFNHAFTHQGRSQDSARGFPKSLGNKGVASRGVRRARACRKCIVPAEIQHCTRRGSLGMKLRKCMESSQLTFDFMTLVPRTPHAEHHSYCPLQARSVASRVPDSFSEIAHALEKQEAIINCAWPHPFCARGGFPGNAQTACLRPCPQQ